MLLYYFLNIKNYYLNKRAKPPLSHQELQPLDWVYLELT